MSCCSLTKARRKLQSNIESTFDSVQASAERINRKTKAELARFPDNIDKGVSSATAKIGSNVRGLQRGIKDITGGIFNLIPGLKGAGNVVKFVAIGAVVLVGLAILRRAQNK